MRLGSEEVQEATGRWLLGDPLRDIHELLDAVGASAETRALLAEAYVRGQAELVPKIRAMHAEIEALLPQKGGRKRKLTSQEDTAKLVTVYERLRGQHPEWEGNPLLEEITTALGQELGDPNLSSPTVKKRLAELSQPPAQSFRFSIRPADPRAALILEGI